MSHLRTAVIKRCLKRDVDPKRPKGKQKWCLYTRHKKKGKRKLLGRHPSKESAQKQERSIQWRKHGVVKYRGAYYRLAVTQEEVHKWMQQVLPAVLEEGKHRATEAPAVAPQKKQKLHPFEQRVEKTKFIKRRKEEGPRKLAPRSWKGAAKELALKAMQKFGPGAPVDFTQLAKSVVETGASSGEVSYQERLRKEEEVRKEREQAEHKQQMAKKPPVKKRRHDPLRTDWEKRREKAQQYKLQYEKAEALNEIVRRGLKPPVDAEGWSAAQLQRWLGYKQQKELQREQRKKQHASVVKYKGAYYVPVQALNQQIDPSKRIPQTAINEFVSAQIHLVQLDRYLQSVEKVFDALVASPGMEKYDDKRQQIDGQLNEVRRNLKVVQSLVSRMGDKIEKQEETIKRFQVALEELQSQRAAGVQGISVMARKEDTPQMVKYAGHFYVLAEDENEKDELEENEVEESEEEEEEEDVEEMELLDALKSNWQTILDKLPDDLEVDDEFEAALNGIDEVIGVMEKIHEEYAGETESLPEAPETE